jgi:pyruvate formate-lyase activating enzyme-like uncharacterized protein
MTSDFFLELGIGHLEFDEQNIHALLKHRFCKSVDQNTNFVDLQHDPPLDYLRLMASPLHRTPSITFGHRQFGTRHQLTKRNSDDVNLCLICQQK